jgi:DNA-binding CsgD family transcriptional regulator
METSLTPKAQQTLDLLKEGYNAKEIAHQQGRSREAVESHIERLRKKFQCRNTVHMIALYAQGKIAA